MRFISKILGQMNLLKAIVLLVIIVFFVAASAITITAQSGFCNSCHIMNDYYASWEESVHYKHEVGCLDCHIQPGAGNYVKGKINGLSQAVDCMVGRVGTKPEAVVPDVTCLRSSCHTSDALDNDDKKFNGVNFTHEGHVGQTVNGIKVTCGTCHNHYEGNEHFSVRNDSCFTCHFLTSSGDNEGLNPSKVGCLDCHDVPDKTIDQGYVKINHKEFAEYQTNCGESCHKKQVSVQSKVDKNTCLACHTYSLSDKWTAEELHHDHTAGEKVECFSCHGTVEHGVSGAISMTDMFECRNCHSDTHTVQQDIFGASNHPTGVQDDKVLSSMFLTHVECTDCHIQTTEVLEGTVNSFGTVAKAVPEACDVCHGPGSGEMYISLW
ncbi:MAG: NapC/NirT family cytochrome c, partial [Anaerohalosphaera sp.]|nr:NapC/NirT family cytochrome c [Anaerohalosphaera sp.]